MPASPLSAAEHAAIDRAVDLLRRGGLVGIPTETVYGLAADASNATAVRRVFAVKGRPPDHPLIVHIVDADHLDAWCDSVPPAAAVLADACWPGPLTLLVPRSKSVIDEVTGGRDAVGIRVPAHPLTTELLRRFGGGVAAPSANRFGRVSPTTAAHVLADLGDDVDMVLDGGPCPIGVESTIVDCTVDPPQVLRPGGIHTEDVEQLLRDAGTSRLAAPSGPSRASGMLASHYAPRCPVFLAETAGEAIELAAAESGRVLVGLDLEPVAYAQRLYDDLREADRRGATAIVALLPPASGLGHAIRDRLFKAAADRAG